MTQVPEKTIWADLLAEGASSIQAAGIMGNMQNESSFDPEAVGDQGTSFGLVQQHGSQYARLVTGNTQADLTAQLANIKGDIGLASGSTASAAGSSFAANFEKCVGCQVGGAQNQQRAANAAAILQAAQTGNWPQQSTGAAASSSNSVSGGLPCSILDPLGCVANAGSGLVTDFWKAPLQILSDSFGGFGIKEIIERAGLIIMGAILIIVGLVVLVKPSNIAEGAALVAAPEAAPAIAAEHSQRAVANKQKKEQ